MDQTTPFIRRHLALGVCLLLFLSCCLWPVFDPASYEPYESWYSIGPVQVLGGPDDVWVFAEKSVMIRIPGRLVSVPVRSIGHYQEVVIFDANGEKSRITVRANGPTFHSNIGRIFRQPDGFYLIQGESMGNYRSMYRWAGDHFQLLPLEESEAWLSNAGFDLSRLPLDPAIDHMTATNGWTHLYYDNAILLFKDDVFAWENLRLQFKAAREGPRITYAINSIDPQRPLNVSVLAFDEDRREVSSSDDPIFSDQNRRGSGHPKP